MSILYYFIDEETRKLRPEAAHKVVAQKDHNADVIRVGIPETMSTVDLETSAVRCMYQRPKETEVRSKTATYYDTSGGYLWYDWTLQEGDTARAGKINFSVCLQHIEGGLLTVDWNTTIGEIYVKTSYHSDDSDEADESITPTVAQRVAVLESVVNGIAGGAPIVVSSASKMTDTSRIYVLTTDGNWYYYDGSAWTVGGEYGGVAAGSITTDKLADGAVTTAKIADGAITKEKLSDDIAFETDKTLSVSGMPADAKIAGDSIKEIREDLNTIIDVRIPLDVSDVVDAYPSTTIDSVITFTSSAKTKTYKKIIEVTQGKTYILNVENSSSPASITTRNTVITDANNVVKQVIDITTTANTTFTTEFVSATDGFLYLCVDKNAESVWIQSNDGIDRRIDEIEQEIDTLSKQLVSSVGETSINLFDKSALKFYTDFYSPDGSISTGNNEVCVGNLDVSPNTTYTVSCSFGASGLYLRVNELDESGDFVKRSTVSTGTGAKRYSITITTTASTKKLQIAPNSYTSSYKGSTENLNVQVQLGDVATEYEEYKKPLIDTVEDIQSDIDDVKAVASEIDGKQNKYLNKNLFVDDLEFYTDFYAPNGTVATGSADVCVGEVEAEPNTEYTISCSFGERGRILRVNELDASKAFITRSVSKTATGSERMSQTFTTGNSTKYLQIAPNTYTSKTTGTTNGLELQVEKGDTATTYITGKSVESEISNIKRDFVTIYIAASNASDESKKYADYVCTGVNDEAVINHVLNQYAEIGCTIKLSEGEFVIDSISKNDDNVMPTAILFMGGRVRTTFNIIGTGIPGVLIADGGTPGSGTFTKFRISSVCYSALDTNTPVSIFRCRSKKVKFNLENFGIHAPSNSKPITYINGFYSENICLKDLWVWNDDYAQSPIPHENCYGVVGTKGSNLGISYEWSRVDVYGCYEAFRISGEHLILRQCVARFGVYPYTFGIVENTDGACTHPTTLINCADECNARMPLFGFNGEYRSWGTENGGNQAVTFIDYNMEWGNNYVPAVERQYATELHPGMFKGRIEYTIQAGWGAPNSKTIPFWAPGSGHGFVSRNQAQDLSGTTSERLNYSNHGAANYMQLYYDTNMNKMVMFDGTKWIDMNGIAVDS